MPTATVSAGTGLADAYLLPLILGWNGRAHIGARAMAGIVAPTGRFEATANDNVGSGYWSPTLASGQTVQMLKNKTLNLLSVRDVRVPYEARRIGHPSPARTLIWTTRCWFALPSAGGAFEFRWVLRATSSGKTTAKDRT